MKQPNGFGSVYKMPGKRRKPYRATVTLGWSIDKETGKRKQTRATIGYFENKKDAIQALALYNEDPYDFGSKSLTFSEVYEKWSEEYFKTVVPSAVRTVKLAYNYCQQLYDIPMKDLRVMHLEKTIEEADVGSSTKGRIKSVFNLMYKLLLSMRLLIRTMQHFVTLSKEKRRLSRESHSVKKMYILYLKTNITDSPT